MITDENGNFKVISTGLKASSSGGGTATERASEQKSYAMSQLDNYLNNGTTLTDAIRAFSGIGGLTATEIYERYNQIGFYGPAQEDAEELAKLGVKVIGS
jgi:hypothetical protein